MFCVLNKTYDKTFDYAYAPIKEQLIHMLKMAKQVKSKNYVPLFHFYNLVENPVLGGNYMNRPRKINKNIAEFEAIILDYDDGKFTIQEAQDQFKKYWHIGYTSFSHTEDCHRFRVVLPLEKPINAKFIRQNRDKILSHYPHVDGTCLHVGRFFYFPCYKNFDDYICWVSEGEPYRIPGKYPVIDKPKKIILNKEKLPSRDNRISRKLREYEVNKIYVWARKRMENIDFNIRGTGVVHDALLRINASLRHEGLEEDEILEVMLEFSNNDSLTQEISSIVKNYDPEF